MIYLIYCDVIDVLSNCIFPPFIPVPAENIVMQTLAARGTVKTFSEKIMLLVNRGGKYILFIGLVPLPVGLQRGQFQVETDKFDFAYK